MTLSASRPLTEQAVLDELANWINDGGWTVSFRLNRLRSEFGVHRDAEVSQAVIEPHRVEFTLAGGQSFALTDVELVLPPCYQLENGAQFTVRLPHTRTQQAPGGAPEVITEHIDAFTIQVTGAAAVRRLEEFTGLVNRFVRGQRGEARQGRLDHIALAIQQAHPGLKAVRITSDAPHEPENTRIELDIPGGPGGRSTTLKLRLVEVGGNDEEVGEFHFVVGGHTI